MTLLNTNGSIVSFGKKKKGDKFLYLVYPSESMHHYRAIFTQGTQQDFTFRNPSTKEEISSKKYLRMVGFKPTTLDLEKSCACPTQQHS